MKFCFGDIVVVEDGLIGVVVKSRCKSLQGNPANHDVYVRMYNDIRNYKEQKWNDIWLDINFWTKTR